MSTYVSLMSFTDQGIHNVRDTVKRADAAKAAAAKFGCKIVQIYWTMGQHDLVLVTKAPEDAALAAFGLAIGSLGDARTQMMRAFTQDEMGTVLGKMLGQR